jgi:YfiH family protein
MSYAQYSQIQKRANYRFVFGDKRLAIPDFSGKYVLGHCMHQKLCKDFDASTVKMAKQVHGINGIVIDKNNLAMACNGSVEGDFIITDQSRVLLLVLTADCLPVFLYDPILNIIGVIHVGWRGLMAGILEAVLDNMVTIFNSRIHDLELRFGPSALRCCYEVKADFIEQVKAIDSSQIFCKSLVIKDGLFFFDLLAYAVFRLCDKGVLRKNISLDFVCCTLCSNDFFSHRKDKGKTGRNVSGIMLL